MEDRTKDSLLVTAEVLIELRQMKADNNRLFGLMIEGNRRNTDRMLEVFDRGFTILHERIDRVDERLGRLEESQGN